MYLIAFLAFAFIGQTQGSVEYLSDIQDRFLVCTQGWGMLGLDVCAHTASQTPLPLSIGGKRYAKGVGHHAYGEIIVDLSGEYSEFDCDVGVEDQGHSVGSVTFEVWVDGARRFESGVMRDGDAAKPVHVTLAGAQELRLVVTDAGDGIYGDAGDWADARLTRVKPRKETPMLDIAPFARLVTSDPNRKQGTLAGRTEEFPGADIFLETDLPRFADGCVKVRDCVGLVWLETRAAKSFAIAFVSGSPIPDPAKAQVECWFGETEHQGEWKPIEGAIEQKERRWTFTPKSPGACVGVRKMRWLMPGGPYVVGSVSAFSPWRTGTTELLVTGGGKIGVYNGEILKATSAHPRHITVRYIRSKVAKGEGTVLLVSEPKRSFGVAVSDVLGNGCVWVKDLGVFVTTAKGPTLAQYRKHIAKQKTVLERVRAMPDQSFERALAKTHNPMQDNGPMMLSLACDNHKFIAHQGGALEECDPGTPVDRDAGPRPPVVVVRPTLGSGHGTEQKGSLCEGWMPGPVRTVKDGALTYIQRTFVAPSGDEGKPVCVAEFTVSNDGASPARASLAIGFEGTAATFIASEVALTADGKTVAFVIPGEMVCYVTAQGATLTKDLATGGVAHCWILLPTWPVSPDQRSTLGEPDALYDAFRKHWEAALGDGIKIDIPDKFLMDVIRASQVHCLIAARSEGKTVAPWIASAIYGPLESESNSIVRGMDMLGHHDFARRSLDFFIKRYNKQGFLTTGYTVFGTGWHLWTLGEHYALAHDDGWMKGVAPEVARVCEWVMRQRDKTMSVNDAPEHGLMPPGVIADWGVYAFYMMLNSYYCAGLRDAGQALKAIGQPGADKMVKTAGQFARDIAAAYHRTQAVTPVVPLQDGTWVPGYPSQIRSPGHMGDFYPGEDGNRSWCYDIEAGAHQMIPTGVLAPNGIDSKWILEQMEDGPFLAEGWFDYSADKNHEDWFDRGGFSKVQPYYCRNAEVYALRDDVKPFIRSYFNTLAAMLNTRNLSLWEHFHNTGAWNKTHETGYLLQQTRFMFVMEHGNALWLAPFVPSVWLKDGSHVAIADAPTRFGPVAYQISSSADTLTAQIDPPQRSTPTEIVIRLRHPSEKPIKSVTVNGRKYTAFDPVRSIVRLKPSTSRITVVARY